MAAFRECQRPLAAQPIVHFSHLPEGPLRQFCQFYRSINWGRIFGNHRSLPVIKVKSRYIDRPRRYG
jgi:hypothetical protein